jgi:hypothetical protein
VHAERAAKCLLRPSLTVIGAGHRWGLPVLAPGVSTHAQGLRLRGFPGQLALPLPQVLPSPDIDKVGMPEW